MKTAPKSFLFRLLPVAMLLFIAIIFASSLRHPPLQNPPGIQTDLAPQEKTIPSPEASFFEPPPTEQAIKPALTTSLDYNTQTRVEEAFKTVARMTELLDDGEELQALGEIRTLRRHPNREVRLSVIEAVRWIGLPAAMDAAAMIDDSDEEIRLMAQDTFWTILRELDDPQLKKDLLETALSSNDPELRIEVLDELLYLPDELSRDLLLRALNDPNETVAEQARDNLSFITGE